ncbi:AsmA family protein [Chitinophagaceae bacterium MMS25-I14]
MPHWLKIILRIAAGFIGLFIILWFILEIYISTHKKQILRTVTEQLSEQVQGTLTIGDMEPTIWRTFPNVAVLLKNVSLRDSLWNRHHHDLLQANKIYVRLNTRKLISGNIEIQKITASYGRIYLFTDSSGYSNSYLFTPKPKNPGKETKKHHFSCDKFSLEEMQLIFEHKIKNKLFRIDIHSLDGKAVKENEIWNTTFDLRARINDFNFNTEKGSYLRNANLKANLKVTYNPKDKHLYVPDQPLQLNAETMSLEANFYFGMKPPPFDLHLHTNKIKFREVVSWLSPNISCKLDSINLMQPIKVEAYIKGVMKFRDTPQIAVLWEVKNNVLQTPFDNFTDCSFKGSFFNNITPGKGHNDMNSSIQVTNVKARWMGIPFMSDTAELVNLVHPYIHFGLNADFALSDLNDLSEEMPFHFNSGRAKFDLKYTGSVAKSDTLLPEMNGTVTLRDVNFIYLPRGLDITNANATMEFKKDNLLFHDVSVHKGGTLLHMTGDAEHIMRFYFADPGKVSLHWNITGPQLNLGDFLSFVGRRKKGTIVVNAKKERSKQANRVLSQMNKVLDEADVNIDVHINRLNFRKFSAQDVEAHAVLESNNINLKQIHYHHADGDMEITGKISEAERNNPFNIHATISNVSVDKMFYGFENFGQHAIQAENVKGRLSAQIDMTGQMTEGAAIIDNSLYGTIDFQLKNGAIINFDPFTKVSKFAFKSRNLDNVMLKDLSGSLQVAGDKIIIPPLHIVSSALYLNVQGVYGPPSNTDIAIELPLRNPEKDASDKDNPNSITPRKKGLILNLRAKDGPDGKVKISLDPVRFFKKEEKPNRLVFPTRGKERREKRRQMRQKK